MPSAAVDKLSMAWMMGPASNFGSSTFFLFFDGSFSRHCAVASPFHLSSLVELKTLFVFGSELLPEGGVMLILKSPVLLA
jgi:hypothetical protein